MKEILLTEKEMLFLVLLDFYEQNEKLQHFDSMLGVVKVNKKKQQLFTLKTDISANTFQKRSSE